MDARAHCWKSDARLGSNALVVEFHPGWLTKDMQFQFTLQINVRKPVKPFEGQSLYERTMTAVETAHIIITDPSLKI